MKTFEIVNNSNIEEASIGDIFTGYGHDGKDIKLKYKNIEHLDHWNGNGQYDLTMATFIELNKNGEESRFEHRYISSFHNTEMIRHRIKTF